MVTKRHALLCCMAIVAACSSSSTSPNSPNAPKSPGSASKGDSVNLNGTYSLVYFQFDSTDGNTVTQNADANDGATLALTTTTYALTWSGSFTQNDQSTHGSYEAVDTSSASQRGTIALYDSVKARTQNGVYVLSNDTLRVSLPDNSGSGSDVTVWIKQ